MFHFFFMCITSWYCTETFVCISLYLLFFKSFNSSTSCFNYWLFSCCTYLISIIFFSTSILSHLTLLVFLFLNSYFFLSFLSLFSFFLSFLFLPSYSLSFLSLTSLFLSFSIYLSLSFFHSLLFSFSPSFVLSFSLSFSLCFFLPFLFIFFLSLLTIGVMTPNITAAPKGSEGYQLGQTAWGVSTENQSVPFPLTLFLISVLIFLPIY